MSGNGSSLYCLLLGYSLALNLGVLSYPLAFGVAVN